MFNALKVDYRFHLVGEFLIGYLHIPLKLVLDHRFERGPLESSHFVKARFDFALLSRLKLGPWRHQHNSGALRIGEDSVWNAPLEALMVKVERGGVLAALLGQLEQVKLVVSRLHLLLPIIVMVVALVPEELLIEELW